MSAPPSAHLGRLARLVPWSGLLLCVGLALTAPGVAAQSSPETLLERARYEVEIRGDLEAAVRIYRDLVEQHADQREIAARALFELGRAYETLGEEEARGAYTRVVEEYGDQVREADAARSRLAALEAESTPAATGVVIRRVWSSAAMPGPGSASPDGVELAFIDWPGSVNDPSLPNRAEPAVIDTRSGRARPVGEAPPKDTYALDPVWRDDGRRIAFSVWDTTWTHTQVRVVRPDGSGERVLVGENRHAHIHLHDWRSATGEIAALIVEWDDVTRIGLLSEDDGSLRILRSVGTYHPEFLSLSPDGRHLVYATPVEGQEGARDLRIIRTDGTEDRALAPHPADDGRAFWTPDGSHVVFLSDRSGRPGLWSVPVRDGEGTAEPRLVHADVGEIVPFDMTEDGALLYLRPNTRSFVHIAELNLVEGAFTVEPRPVSERNIGSNTMPSWSPDGARVAYYSLRGAGRDRTAELVIGTPATGEERPIPLPFEPYPQSAPSWTADGTAMMVEGGRGGERVSYRVSLATGEAEELPYLTSAATRSAGRVAFVTPRQRRGLAELGLRLAGQNDHTPYVEGDRAPRPGETVLHVRNGVWTLDPTRPAEEWKSWTGTGLRHMHAHDLSPDGRTLALALASDRLGDSDHLVLLDLETRETRGIARPELQEGTEIEALRWTSDGRHVLFVVGGEDPRAPAPVWLAPVEGGEPRRLGIELSPEALMSLSFHPDGRRVAFATWAVEAEVWALEGLPWRSGGDR